MNPFDLPGPQFLVFYVIFAGLVIAGMVFWRKRAESSQTPKIDLSDPYLIAYLRAGEREVLRVATIALVEKGLLIQEGRQIKRAEHASPNSVQRPIEKVLLKKYTRSGEVSWIFEDEGLSKACESYARTLRTARLLPDDWVNQARLIRLVVVCFLLTGVGFTKILLAIEAGRTNVGFLVLLIIVAMVIAARISFPRLTESGKIMLEDVRSLYHGLRTRALTADPGTAGVEPMMLAAVFGVGALAGPMFAFADVLFPRRNRGNSNSCGSGDGGCGSSCSSSSCSSGSSCGSSCGGGCGGCGGS